MVNVPRYLVAIRQAGLSAATIKQYTWHLERLRAWLLARGVGLVMEVDRDTLREWGAELRNGWAPATVKQGVGAARSFFRWCFAEGLTGEDLGLALAVPRVPARVQRTITSDEVRQLLAGCDRSTVRGRRDAALVTLLIDTGLRAHEVCRLELDDLRLESFCLLATVKGGDQAVVSFGGSTARRIADWLEIRPERAVAGCSALFISVGGNTPGLPLTTRGLRSLLRRLGDSQGVAEVTTHAFRRGFAVIAMELGAPSRSVMGAGRWKNLREVERYSAAWQRAKLYERHSPADFCDSG